MKHKTNTSNHIQMENGDVAYIKLPEFGESPKISKQISLRDLLDDFKGSDVFLDFSEDGVLIGIEILAF